MYFFGVLKPDDVARAYAKDAVIFIFGVLAVSTAISKNRSGPSNRFTINGAFNHVAAVFISVSAFVGRRVFVCFRTRFNRFSDAFNHYHLYNIDS